MATQETDYNRVVVAESGRVAIIATFHPATGDINSRITVRRADGGGKRITVGWDYSKEIGENYAEAVRRYVELMEWGGRWTVGATRNGAVATWAGWT